MSGNNKTTLRRAMRRSFWAFLAVAIFSMVLNALMLTSPLFMLQVYDRVLASQSVPTLIALSALVLGLFGLAGLLELVRSRILVRIGLSLDQQVSAPLFNASTRYGLGTGQTSARHFRDLETLRQFIGGPGPASLFDLPWAPAYLALLYMFHPILGAVGIVGAVLLIVLAIATEVVTRRGTPAALSTSTIAQDLAEAAHKNAGALMAMGMGGHYRERWLAANRRSTIVNSRMTDRLMFLQATSKSLRMILQSAVLAVGAYLAILGDITPGTIVAASIILGRGLAPFEQAIGHWRSFSRARLAYREISKLLSVVGASENRTQLPQPTGLLDVIGLRAAPPGDNRVVLNGVTFSIAPGQVLAVIGPSASGKSTLCRCMVGIAPWVGGEVRLDGARLDHWDVEALGQHIGYVPQESELFAGTVRDNISRFDPSATDQSITEAALAARAHQLILSLPSGYETELGSNGAHLSAGQKQRIALARALYGSPTLIVLDEPNSNLDSFGDAALLEVISDLKAAKRTVVIVSHRSTAIAHADLVLALEEGQQRAFGPRDDVMAKLNQLFRTASASNRSQSDASVRERQKPETSTVHALKTATAAKFTT